MKKITRKKGRKLIQSKKSNYDNKEFDSQLELYLYKRLQEEQIMFSFNEKSFTLIPAFKYPQPIYEPKKVKEKGLVDKSTIRKMAYTPDFVADDESWIIETKGRANESFPLRWKIFKNLMSERDKVPMLFLPRNKEECEQTITILKQWINKEQK